MYYSLTQEYIDGIVKHQENAGENDTHIIIKGCRPKAEGQAQRSERDPEVKLVQDKHDRLHVELEELAKHVRQPQDSKPYKLIRHHLRHRQ